MQKIKIRLPATLTNFGPALDSLGLAIGLYTHVEFTPRSDEKLLVETEGEGAGEYALGLRHPVVRSMSRFFQQLEGAPLGVHIKIKNEIPIACGLGAETAFQVAGVIGANNLMNNLFKREQLIHLSAKFSSHADGAIASFVGGLSASYQIGENIIYRSLPVQPFQVILAIPEINNYSPPPNPERLLTADAQANLRKTALLIDALRTGDLALMAQVLGDDIQQASVASRIPGYAHIAEVARLAGALTTSTAGKGPAMVFLAKKDHHRIIEIIETAFANLNIKGRVLIVPVDTQGVVISMMQSA